jgi:hypothetical protein
LKPSKADNQCEVPHSVPGCHDSPTGFERGRKTQQKA